MTIDLRDRSCEIAIMTIAMEVEREGKGEFIIDPSCVDVLVSKAEELGLSIDRIDRATGYVVVGKKRSVEARRSTVDEFKC